MALFAVTLTVGITVAYYNTHSLAFDEPPVIFSQDETEYRFLDFTVKKSDIERIKKGIENFMPSQAIKCGGKIAFDNTKYARSAPETT